MVKMCWINVYYIRRYMYQVIIVWTNKKWKVQARNALTQFLLKETQIQNQETLPHAQKGSGKRAQHSAILTCTGGRSSTPGPSSTRHPNKLDAPMRWSARAPCWACCGKSSWGAQRVLMGALFFVAATMAVYGSIIPAIMPQSYSHSVQEQENFFDEVWSKNGMESNYIGAWTKLWPNVWIASFRKCFFLSHAFQNGLQNKGLWWSLCFLPFCCWDVVAPLEARHCQMRLSTKEHLLRNFTEQLLKRDAFLWVLSSAEQLG